MSASGGKRPTVDGRFPTQSGHSPRPNVRLQARAACGAPLCEPLFGGTRTSTGVAGELILLSADRARMTASGREPTFKLLSGSKYRRCVPKGVCTLYNTHYPTLRGVAAGCLTQGSCRQQGPRGSAFGQKRTFKDPRLSCAAWRATGGATETKSTSKNASEPSCGPNTAGSRVRKIGGMTLRSQWS